MEKEFRLHMVFQSDDTNRIKRALKVKDVVNSKKEEDTVRQMKFYFKK